MSHGIHSTVCVGRKHELNYVTVQRVWKSPHKQVHIGLKGISLFLYEEDALKLCNRIIDELER